jgi:putative peptidoglycan lipid II flippase
MAFLGGRNLFKAFLMLSSGSVVGKIIGFLREVLMAALFGTSVYVGAYRVAQTAMLMPVELFLTNSIEAGFVPLYARYIKDDSKKAELFLSSIVILFLLLAAVVFLFLYLGSSWWVKTLAPGMDTSSKALAASMLRIMTLAVPLYILGMLLSYLEMIHGKYIAASLRSTVQSIGLISGALLAFYFKDPLFLAWGFTGAYGIYLLWVLSRLRSIRVLHRPTGLSWDLTKEALWTFWRCVRPVLFVPILIQGSMAVERIVASLLGIRAISALDYAKFITESGVILIATPLSMVGLSTLSGLDPNLVRQKVGQIANIILILTIPISVLILCYHTNIVNVIYARGAFDQESVAITAKILFGFSIGLWAQVWSYYFIRILNAQLRNTEVMLYTSIAIFLDIGVKILLYKNLGPMVLGLGVSVNSVILCFLTVRALRLGKELYLSFLWMAIGVIIYMLIHAVVYYIGISQQYLLKFANLPIELALFLLYWAIYIFIVPNLRIYIYCLFINKLRDLLNINN